MIGQSNFIRKDTAEKVRAVIDKKPEEGREESLFYKVRPVRLTSSFTDGAASGEFINASGEAVTGATGITLYNVEGKGGGASGDMIWGVYRGRWEQITEPSEWRCWFYNEGAATIAPGEFCGIHGLIDHELSSKEALQKWQQEGLRLRVKRYAVVDDANAAYQGQGVAIDAIAPGQTGRGVTTDVFCALVHVADGMGGEYCADWKTARYTESGGTARDYRMLQYVKFPGDYIIINSANKGPATDFWDSSYTRGIATGDFTFSLVKPMVPGPFLSKITEVTGGKAVLTKGQLAKCNVKTLTASDVGAEVMVWKDCGTRDFRLIPPYPT